MKIPNVYGYYAPPTLMFIDANRRRDDFGHDGEVRPRRGIVRTHTIRAAPPARGAFS